LKNVQSETLQTLQNMRQLSASARISAAERTWPLGLQ
jgi:hypothetical protein